MFWSQRPAFRILIWYIAGILVWNYFVVHLDPAPFLIWMGTGLSFLTYIFVIIGLNRHVYRWLTGLSFGLLFFFLGILVSSLQLSNQENPTPENAVYLARLVSDPGIGENVITVALEAYVADSSLKTVQSPLHIQAYFEKCSRTEELRYGDLITIKGSPVSVASPLNPEEFDYRNFLAMKNIHFSMYIDNSSWKSLGVDPPNRWLARAYQTRWKLLSILKSSGLNKEEFAVAAAILLGNDDFMDATLRQNFVYAGAMHILCVSGLHVGIIFIIFNFLLGFLNKNSRLRILKATILIVLVWVYASITGLSPSVLRAGLMVSIFILSQLTSWHKDNLNTLIASAVIILLFNPMLLFHIGFQLSYAAVAGILLLYQPIYHWLYFKNRAADVIWSITALSLSAQLATFPLAVYYFHFFPTWFWLTNLFTYPLSFAILTGGMAFIVFSWVPYLSQILGWCMAGLVYLLNYVVELVKFLPFPGITNLYLPFFEVILVYLFIAILFGFILQNKWRLLLPTLLLTSLLLLTETIQHWRHLQQQGLVVYQIRKHSVIQFVEGTRSHILADSVLSRDLSAVSFTLQSSQAKWGLKPTGVKTDTSISRIGLTGFYQDGPFILADNRRILLLDGKANFVPIRSRLPVDLVIVTGKPRIKPENLLKIVQTDTLVTDGSVPRYWKKQFSELAKQEDIRFIDTSTDGAFMAGIK